MYYVLAVRFDDDYPLRVWSAEFGAYDRDDVEYERDALEIYGGTMVILKLKSADQSAIDEAIDILNEMEEKTA